MGGHLRLEVLARLRGGLDLARQHQAHTHAAGDLDRQVLPLLRADSRQRQQVRLLVGRPGDPQGVHVDRVVDHAGPGELRRRRRLGAGDRHQACRRPERPVELGLGGPQGTVDRVNDRELGREPGQGGQHDPSGVVVDDGAAGMLAHPAQCATAVGEIEPALVR